MTSAAIQRHPFKKVLKDRKISLLFVSQQLEINYQRLNMVLNGFFKNEVIENKLEKFIAALEKKEQVIS